MDAERCSSEVPAACQDPLTAQLAQAMQNHFGDDARRIAHALRVLGHAREIMQAEGGDPRVIILLGAVPLALFLLTSLWSLKKPTVADGQPIFAEGEELPRL